MKQHDLDQLNFDKLNIQGFQDFVSSLNVVGLAVGAILGNAISSISSSLGQGVIGPVIELALGFKDMTFNPPRFNFMAIFEKILTFAITAGIIYAIVTVFDIKVKKPVTHVKIVGSEEPGGAF